MSPVHYRTYATGVTMSPVYDIAHTTGVTMSPGHYKIIIIIIITIMKAIVYALGIDRHGYIGHGYSGSLMILTIH